MSFEEKVILITGASSGIGADAARHLAGLGARVSIVGRNSDRLHDVADQIIISGAPLPLPIVADVTKDGERIVKDTINHFGKLDVLINSAGAGLSDNILTVNISDFDSLVDVNVRSVINLTKLCLPHLEKTKGNIVNVTSVNRTMPNFLSSLMSKAALDQFTKCAALDLASKRIRVNSICPAAIRTPAFDKYFKNTDEAEKSAAMYK